MSDRVTKNKPAEFRTPPAAELTPAAAPRLGLEWRIVLAVWLLAFAGLALMDLIGVVTRIPSWFFR
jgi:hypothetical protein